MSDVTRLEFMDEPIWRGSDAERHAARLSVASWCARNSLGSEAVGELLDELGLA